MTLPKVSQNILGHDIYIIKIKWKSTRKGSTGKEITNCVRILGPIGCNINGGGGIRGIPHN
jgi:hypothetical protein